MNTSHAPSETSLNYNIALPFGPSPEAQQDDHDRQYRVHLENYIQQLTARIDELATGLQQSETCIANLQQQLQIAVSNKNPKSLKINNPQEFHGDRKKTKPFLRQLQTAFDARPEDFFNDYRKIQFAISFLRGLALEHIGNLRDSGKIPNTFSDFKTLLTSAFGETNEERQAVHKLRSLKQGNSSCVKYTNLFNNLALKSNYNDSALQDYFKIGLNKEIKDLLLTRARPKDLKQLQDFAIECDDRIFEEKSERNPRRDFKDDSDIRDATQKRSSSTPPALGSGHDPMDCTVGALQPEAKKMSKSERRAYRLKNNLCLYCGKSDCGGPGNTKNCKILIKNEAKRGKPATNQPQGNDQSR